MMVDQMVDWLDEMMVALTVEMKVQYWVETMAERKAAWILEKMVLMMVA